MVGGQMVIDLDIDLVAIKRLHVLCRSAGAPCNRAPHPSMDRRIQPINSDAAYRGIAVVGIGLRHDSYDARHVSRRIRPTRVRIAWIEPIPEYTETLHGTGCAGNLRVGQRIAPFVHYSCDTRVARTAGCDVRIAVVHAGKKPEDSLPCCWG